MDIVRSLVATYLLVMLATLQLISGMNCPSKVLLVTSVLLTLQFGWRILATPAVDCHKWQQVPFFFAAWLILEIFSLSHILSGLSSLPVYLGAKLCCVFVIALMECTSSRGSFCTSQLLLSAGFLAVLVGDPTAVWYAGPIALLSVTSGCLYLFQLQIHKESAWAGCILFIALAFSSLAGPFFATPESAPLDLRIRIVWQQMINVPDFIVAVIASTIAVGLHVLVNSSIAVNPVPMKSIVVYNRICEVVSIFALFRPHVTLQQFFGFVGMSYGIFLHMKNVRETKLSLCLTFVLLLSILPYSVIFNDYISAATGDINACASNAPRDAYILPDPVTLHAESLCMPRILHAACDKCTLRSRPHFCHWESLRAERKYHFSTSTFKKTRPVRVPPKTDAIFVAAGNVFQEQDYAWYALKQWRLFNPIESGAVYFTVSRGALAHDRVPAHAADLNITLVFAEDLYEYCERGCPLSRFRKLKRTGEQKQYDRFVLERFYLIHAVMLRYRLQHIIHIENDVTFYAEANRVVSAAMSCGARLASTYVQVDTIFLFVPTLLYVAWPSDLYHMLQFWNDLIACGKEFTDSLGTIYWENDMRLLGLYYEAHGAEHLAPLPSWNAGKGENCILDVGGAYFDAARFGQLISWSWLLKTGTEFCPQCPAILASKLNSITNYFPPPTGPSWITWKQDVMARWTPWWNGKPLYCLHIHAKNVRDFALDPPSPNVMEANVTFMRTPLHWRLGNDKVEVQ